MTGLFHSVKNRQAAACAERMRFASNIAAASQPPQAKDEETIAAQGILPRIPDSIGVSPVFSAKKSMGESPMLQFFKSLNDVI